MWHSFLRIAPSLITAGNLFCGFWAIISVTQGRLVQASWLIIICFILDGLDGTVARLIHQSTPFGIELDSFADIVSFGVAPSLFLYQAVFYQMGDFGVLISFIPLVACVARLIRFNIQTKRTGSSRIFIGLPTPSFALTIVGLFLYHNATTSGHLDPAPYLSLVPFLSLLMLSPVPYRKMPLIAMRPTKHPVLPLALLLVPAALVIWNPSLTVFPIMALYILTGLLF